MMRHTSLSLMLACMIPFTSFCADLPTLQVSLQFDSDSNLALQWEMQDPDAEYVIYALDEAGARIPYAVVKEGFYSVASDFPHYEVEAIRDGVVLSTSGTLLNPTYNAAYPNYTTDEWLQIAPYLLPNTHPVKPKLEKLFRKERFISTLETLKKGDFDVRGPGSGGTLVAKHKKLPDVLIKIFPDNEPINELKQFMKRINGAQVAREIIAKYHLDWVFKVPRKWIYILPQEPQATGPYPKNLVLVVEDMEVLPKSDNYPMWKSSSMTKKKLDAIFILLTEGGFNDLALAFNIPFCKDGKIAVIDTEDYHKWPIPYNRLNKYLSDNMIDYWDGLASKGGPEGYRPNAQVRKMIQACLIRPFAAPSHELTGSWE
jgi:hypothetical protein